MSKSLSDCLCINLFSIAMIFSVAFMVSVTFIADGLSAELQVIAIDGTPSPLAGENFFLGLDGSLPTLNDNGQLAFAGYVSFSAGSDHSRFYRASSNGVELIARGASNFAEGQYFDGESKRLLEASSLLAINSSGNIAANIDWYPPNNVNSRRDGLVEFRSGQIVSVATEGNALPKSNTSVYPLNYWPAYNDSGQLAFTSLLSPTTGGETDNTALYRWEPATGTLTELVREGNTVPGGGTFVGHLGSFDVFPPPVMNNLGVASFVGKISSQTFDDQGIYVADGQQLMQIARKGQRTPNPAVNRVFTRFEFDRPSINDHNQVAFIASFEYVNPVEGNSSSGIYLSDNGTLRLVAEAGFSIAGYDGWLTGGRSGGIELNNQSQVVYHGEVRSSSSVDRYPGLFLSDANSTGRIIALSKHPAPNGLGVFEDSTNTWMNITYALNDPGQVAYLTTIDTLPNQSGGIIEGLFLDKGDGRVETIALQGMSLLGSTITNLEFAGTVPTGNDPMDQYQGLNNSGQVAFSFRLADDRVGIALWSPTQTGDFDGDGDVDGRDFLFWQRNPDSGTLTGWQLTYGADQNLAGDFDNDGDVDGRDFLVHQRNPSVGSLSDWQQNYGVTGGHSAPATVPEPASLLLLSCSTLVAILRKTRFHQVAHGIAGVG